MTEFRSILPGNATLLERNLELTGDLGKFNVPLDVLRRAKLDAIDSYVPFLIWEYGLGELLPYLKDPRRALSEGILWQRLRGTPQSLVIALDWIDFDAVIEQEETGIYFSEFQLDPGRVIRDASVIPDVIAIARLSAPARSRLSRIYHGYDIRRLKLSEGAAGEMNHHLLSDYSGVHHNGIRISFGETHYGAGQLIDPDVEVRAFADHVDFRRAFVDDIFRMSVGWLDDTKHGPNPYIQHSKLFTFSNEDGVPVTQTELEDRKFQKAQIVLSDSWEESGGLSDHNGTLAPKWYDVFEGEELVTSENIQLSGMVNTFRRVTVLCNEYNVHPGSLVFPDPDIHASHEHTQTKRIRQEGDFVLGWLKLSEDRSLIAPVAVRSSLFSFANGEENGVQIDQVALPHRKFAKAMLVLSDGATISDPNGVTAPYAQYYHGEGMVLSDAGELSERYEHITREEVLCRDVRDTIFGGAYPADAEGVVLHHRLLTNHIKLGDPYPRRLSEDRRDYGPFREMNSPDHRFEDQYWEGLTAPQPSRVDGTGVIDGAQMRTLDQSRAYYPFDERAELSQGGRSASGVTEGAQYKGQHWIDIHWPSDNTWQGINVVIASTHKTETME